MKTFRGIVVKHRGILLILWGLFALWVFSEYMYRFAHSEAWGIGTAIDYSTGSLKHLVVPWIITLFCLLAGYVFGRHIIGIGQKTFKLQDDLQDVLLSAGLGLGLIAAFSASFDPAKVPQAFIIYGILILLLGSYIVWRYSYLSCKHAASLLTAFKKGLFPLKWDILEVFLFLVIAALLLNCVFLPDSLLSTQLAGKAGPYFGGSFTYLFLIGSVIFIYMLGMQFMSRKASLFASMLFLLSRPVWAAILNYGPDHIIGFFILFFFYSCLQWSRNRNPGWLLLAMFAVICDVLNFLRAPIENEAFLTTILFWPLLCIFLGWLISKVFILDKLNPRNRVHLAGMFLLIALAFGVFYRDAIFPHSGTHLVFTKQAIDASQPPPPTTSGGATD
jgi:hypothetical protein